jgi:hypothetical protein
MLLLNALRCVVLSLDVAAVGLLDALLRVCARGLRPYTTLRGAGLIHHDRSYWKGAPVFDAWREPKGYIVRLGGYELIIDLAS